MNTLLQTLRDLLGPEHVLTHEDAEPFLTDWRRVRTGRALAVVRPANTQDVAEIVRLCVQAGVPIVPQGGNTGQVAGAIPDTTGTALVISLQRLNRIRAIDVENNTITVEAGCILQHVQDAAEASDRLFPLSLGAEGSCFIGGNLATNAGGTQVLHYGNTRELTLGLEVVTGEGDILEGLRGLRKDNTGYQLRDLYVGSEGTLGVITAATLKLFPLPKAQHTALLALSTLADATQLLRQAQANVNAPLTAFEVMSRNCLDLVVSTFPDQRLPFDALPPQTAWFVLLEFSDNENSSSVKNNVDNFLEQALENGDLLDGAIASSQAQSNAFWHLRESITLAVANEGYCIKHDVSLPVSEMAEFIETSSARLQETYPGVRMMIFGHLGDGNLHYNLLRPDNTDDTSFAASEAAIQTLVHDHVVSVGGSISAEQGIGSLRVMDLEHYKDPVALKLMRQIKQALDPYGIMNPGKVLARQQ